MYRHQSRSSIRRRMLHPVAQAQPTLRPAANSRPFTLPRFTQAARPAPDVWTQVQRAVLALVR